MAKVTVEKQPAKQIEEVPNQMDQWQENIENARRGREIIEYLAKLIQAEKDAKLTAKEELDRKTKEWMERFPFEPLFHPEITYDPEVYDPVKVADGEWPEEKAATPKK